MASTAYSAWQVLKDPKNPANWAALGADLVCLVVPVATGGGAAVRAASKADDVIDAGKVINRADSIADAGYSIRKADTRADLAICFVKGTKVLTVDGKKNIEDISSGDTVWSENPETGEKGLKEVVQTFVNETEELIHISVRDEIISTTPEHPFYVRDRGWTGAIDLKAGDVLVLQDGGYIIVEKTQHEILETPVTVYNFEVEDFHTYYVSTDNVLVHNVCMKSQAKKIDPAKFEADYNLTRGTFHRDIKPKIIGKVQPNYQVGKNPDILMDRSGNIAYQGVKGKGFQDTGLNIIDLFKELK